MRRLSAKEYPVLTLCRSCPSSVRAVLRACARLSRSVAISRSLPTVLSIAARCSVRTRISFWNSSFVNPVILIIEDTSLLAGRRVSCKLRLLVSEFDSGVPCRSSFPFHIPFKLFYGFVRVADIRFAQTPHSLLQFLLVDQFRPAWWFRLSIQALVAMSADADIVTTAAASGKLATTERTCD